MRTTLTLAPPSALRPGLLAAAAAALAGPPPSPLHSEHLAKTDLFNTLSCIYYQACFTLPSPAFLLHHEAKNVINIHKDKYTDDTFPLKRITRSWHIIAGRDTRDEAAAHGEHCSRGLAGAARHQLSIYLQCAPREVSYDSREDW